MRTAWPCSQGRSRCWACTHARGSGLQPWSRTGQAGRFSNRQVARGIRRLCFARSACEGLRRLPSGHGGQDWHGREAGCCKGGHRNGGQLLRPGRLLLRQGGSLGVCVPDPAAAEPSRRPAQAIGQITALPVGAPAECPSAAAACQACLLGSGAADRHAPGGQPGAGTGAGEGCHDHWLRVRKRAGLAGAMLIWCWACFADPAGPALGLKHGKWNNAPGCHDLPVNVLRRGPGRVERQLRVCSVCGSGQVCDEHHLVLECAALQALRGRWLHLFEGCATMQQFMWQADLVGVAEFVSEGLAVLQRV